MGTLALLQAAKEYWESLPEIKPAPPVMSMLRFILILL